MTTVSQAYTAIRDRLEANPITGLTFAWQNEDNTALPTGNQSFAYIELMTERTFIAEFGGGRYLNNWRTEGRIEAHVFVPTGQGLKVATDYAESIATLFRSFRDSNINCFAAHVEPGSKDETEGNFYVCHAVILLHWDLTG